MYIDGPPDAILRDPKQLGDGGNRELFGQGQNQGIHQQGEAAPGTSPRLFSLRDLAALVALHSRQKSMKEGLELKKVKMLPGPLGAIMNRLITGSAGRAIQPLGATNEIKMNSP